MHKNITRKKLLGLESISALTSSGKTMLKYISKSYYVQVNVMRYIRKEKLFHRRNKRGNGEGRLKMKIWGNFQSCQVAKEGKYLLWGFQYLCGMDMGRQEL